ncbi:TPA: 6-phosphogluconolactonase [Candidatus Woesearchaeota archaeon]|nr:6-phosphogluconolactonase [Candidatus Woesearchaeota archaeon]
MEMIQDNDRKKLDEKAVKLIEESVKRIVAERGRAVLAVCGGTSVSGIFEGLKKTDIPWEDVHIFMVDERLVPSSHPDSNYRLAYKGFIEYLEDKEVLPQANSYSVRLGDDDEETIEDYTEELERCGGRYDILLLSSGEDGHIGALYPNHSVLDDSEAFVIMHDSPKPPPNRMTMSRNLLLGSEVAVLLFYGEGKKEALMRFQDEEVSWEECPAKLVMELPEAYVLTDIK